MFSKNFNYRLLIFKMLIIKFNNYSKHFSNEYLQTYIILLNQRSYIFGTSCKNKDIVNRL